MLNEEPYIEFVIKEAEQKGKIFILDTGEGNDCIEEKTGWYIENLSGWLINPSEKEQLLKSKENGTAYNEFSDSYIFAIWSKVYDGKLEITFKKY